MTYYVNTDNSSVGTQNAAEAASLAVHHKRHGWDVAAYVVLDTAEGIKTERVSITTVAKTKAALISAARAIRA